MNDDFYVYGDLHNYVFTAQRFLDKVKPERVIWLGDFMDNFNDGPDDAERTGHFLKRVVEERPNDVFLLSNHDVCYRFATKLNQKYHLRKPTWGFSVPKLRALNFAFPREYWKKFVICHKESYLGQDVFFSHAGIHARMFLNCQFDEKRLWQNCKMAIQNGDSPREIAWLDSALGPLWMRWPLPLVDGICQVVGHTPQSRPDLIKDKEKGNWNLNLDCAKEWVAHFTPNGIYAVSTKSDERYKIE